jgi:hypothetical protein
MLCRRIAFQTWICCGRTEHHARSTPKTSSHGMVSRYATSRAQSIVWMQLECKVNKVICVCCNISRNMLYALYMVNCRAHWAQVWLTYYRCVQCLMLAGMGIGGDLHECIITLLCGSWALNVRAQWARVGFTNSGHQTYRNVIANSWILPC